MTYKNSGCLPKLEKSAENSNKRLKNYQLDFLFFSATFSADELADNHQTIFFPFSVSRRLIIQMIIFMVIISQYMTLQT